MIDDTTSTYAIIDAYLRQRFPALNNLKPETELLSGGAVDSLGMLDLMMFLGERFGIALEDADFTPDNLATPARLAAFVDQRGSS
jgi:acyl carrier protein